MSDDQVVVSVKNVKKDFHRPHDKSSKSIKSAIIHAGKKRNKEIDTQHALRGVSFDVKKGEFFGIVGRNGSGKSTLLKMIAGIYQPTSGEIETHGKLVPFIELGVGFNPELTGRENVYLNGALLGFTTKEIDAMYDDIVEFAELHEFMEQKLKNYSSGMQVRLAFAVAIKAQGDVLILDEVLAVGDEAFQRKCNDYFFKAKREGRTVILVTHSMDSVRQFCSRAILIDEGKIQAEGNPDKVAARYSKMFIDEYIEEVNQQSDDTDKPVKPKLSDVEVASLKVLQDGKPKKSVEFRKPFSIEVTFDSGSAYEKVVVGVHVVDPAGRTLHRVSTRRLEKYSIKKGINTLRFDIDNILTDGEYVINLAAEEKDSKKLLVQEHGEHAFTVIGLDTSKYSKLSMTHPDITIVVDGEKQSDEAH